MIIEYQAFGEKRLVNATIYANCVPIQESDDLFDPNEVRYDDTLWVERGEDYYALDSIGRNRTIAVVTRSDWMKGRKIENVENETQESTSKFLRD